ncbi:hypothetical protein [Streptomyces lydicus]|uniref:hypothetical protein n=1 Tax=Streptomyces lydicus TaxID=47763 RepID=UPI0037D03261
MTHELCGLEETGRLFHANLDLQDFGAAAPAGESPQDRADVHTGRPVALRRGSVGRRGDLGLQYGNIAKGIDEVSPVIVVDAA